MISVQEATRQLVAYSMEEMRNRGLEEAARLADRRTLSFTLGREIRALKRNPEQKLTNWWAKSVVQIDFVPIGA
jgi:electron transfer flavoprotein alpha/beta subunit